MAVGCHPGTQTACRPKSHRSPLLLSQAVSALSGRPRTTSAVPFWILLITLTPSAWATPYHQPAWSQALPNWYHGHGHVEASSGTAWGLSSRLSSALAVTFRPDGAELAVATLNSHITFWDPENAVQRGSIEGRHDLKTGRKELDKITAKHSAKGK